VHAVECAAELQPAMDAANVDIPDDQKIILRVGISLGDMIVEGTEVFGDGVNIAARLQALAEPGGILVSETVFSHVQGKVQIEFEDFGEHRLKNMPKQVRIFRVSGTPLTSRRNLPLDARHEHLIAVSGAHTGAYFAYCLAGLEPWEEYTA
jgi:adenylate cyclase